MHRLSLIPIIVGVTVAIIATSYSTRFRGARDAFLDDVSRHFAPSDSSWRVNIDNFPLSLPRGRKRENRVPDSARGASFGNRLWIIACVADRQRDAAEEAAPRHPKTLIHRPTDRETREVDILHHGDLEGPGAITVDGARPSRPLGTYWVSRAAVAVRDARSWKTPGKAVLRPERRLHETLTCCNNG